VGETDCSTALPGSDPNYLRKAFMEGNAVVRFEFLHVGDGRRADSSTRFPGASSYCFYYIIIIIYCSYSSGTLTRCY
jgi:hypothetical protein